MKRAAVILIWILALALMWPVAGPLFRQSERPVDALGRLPVLEGGRVKPLDSVARANLLLFRGKQTLSTEAGRKPAIDWMTDLLLDRQKAHADPVFRIDHPRLVGMFGLEPGTKQYFSYLDLQPYLSQIQDHARNANADSGQRGPYESAVVRLFNNLILYQMLTQTVYPLSVEADIGAFYHAQAGAVLEAAARFSGSEPETADPQLRFRMQQLDNMAQSPLFLLNIGDEWVNPASALRTGVPRSGQVPPEAASLARLADSRQAGDEAAFREAVRDLAASAPEITEARPGMEYYFNQSQPFIVSLGVYVLVILLVFLGWQFSPGLFLPPAFGILVAGFAIHTFGLVLRVMITGYAPVTNLYSSAVFTGWVAIVLSILFERMNRRGVGTLAAATVGFLTLLVAHHLADSGDTMEKMRAVLNSNFWLSTHVITITMGYGATFLAGFLAIIYVLYGWMRRGMSQEMQKSFHRMVYGAVCFSLLFSFVGTVLGGIWADQSWGRFWGWDPKENGALMIVLWTAMILHALRCGMIRTRGLMLLSIGGNMITAWSWFGTNMLGVGLHAYGFMDSAFFWLVAFWISQLLVIGLEGLFPVRIRNAA